VLADIELVGRSCGVENRSAAFVKVLRDRIHRVAGRAARATLRPKTVCLEWLAPLFLGGHWVPEMVELAGGIDALGRAGEKSRRVETKEIVMASPEVAVLMPCGFDLERTRKEAPVVTGARWWADLPAARTDRVWLVDGSGYFNRPGPRLVDGLEILAHILQPSLFPGTPKQNAAQRWVG
jgi:iron complex transport system substrate-binding protein